jgi:hypothetical protein
MYFITIVKGVDDPGFLHPPKIHNYPFAAGTIPIVVAGCEVIKCFGAFKCKADVLKLIHKVKVIYPNNAFFLLSVYCISKKL